VGANGLLTANGAEPLAADARPNKDGRPTALLKLIAGMLAVSFDSLRQRDLEQRTARMRRVAALSSLLVMIFGALAVYAFYQQQLAEERSRVALSRQLAVQSGSLQATSADLPVLLSLEALFAEPTVEAKRSLFEALTVHRRPISLLRSPTGTGSNAMVVSPDGKQLISGSERGEIVLWDLTAQGGSAPAAVHLAHSAAISSLSLSADGELLASAGADGAILFWDLRTRQPSARVAIPRQQSEVNAVQFGPRELFAFGRMGADEFGEVVLCVSPPDPETPDCDYAASGSLSIWSRRNWAGERCPWRSISQFSL
jgi:hypothetical protein